MKKTGFLVLLVILMIAFSQLGTVEAVEYTYRPLGLAGSFGLRVHPNAINNDGWIVGYYEFGTPNLPDYAWRAFLQKKGEFIDLHQSFPGASSSNATGINDRGQVVGYWVSEGRLRAFRWEEGMISDLGDGFMPRGISQGEVVAGELDAAASLWTEARGLQDLGNLPGQSGAAAYAVKEVAPRGSLSIRGGPSHPLAERGLDRLVWVVGMATGNSISTGFKYPHGFLWTPQKGMLDLGTLGGLSGYSYDASWAYALNDRGEVVGSSTIGHWGPPGPAETHAFLWTQAEGMRDLGILQPNNNPVHLGSQSRGINDLSQIVGFSGYPVANGEIYHATLWQHGTIQDLNDSVRKFPAELPEDICIGKAYGINNAGNIIGTTETSNNANNDYYGFVLSPKH
jgi:probable HAF family extracellular repeat protein